MHNAADDHFAHPGLGNDRHKWRVSQPSSKPEKRLWKIKEVCLRWAGLENDRVIIGFWLTAGSGTNRGFCFKRETLGKPLPFRHKGMKS